MAFIFEATKGLTACPAHYDPMFVSMMVMMAIVMMLMMAIPLSPILVLHHTPLLSPAFGSSNPCSPAPPWLKPAPLCLPPCPPLACNPSACKLSCFPLLTRLLPCPVPTSSLAPLWLSTLLLTPMLPFAYSLAPLLRLNQLPCSSLV